MNDRDNYRIMCEDSGEDETAIRAELNTPDFDWGNLSRVHDWRRYVPKTVQQFWGDLEEMGRLAVYLTAERMSDKEEWD